MENGQSSEKTRPAHIRSYLRVEAINTMQKEFNRAVSKLRKEVSVVDYYLRTYLNSESTKSDYYNTLDSVASKVGIDFGISPVQDQSEKTSKYLPYLNYRPGNLLKINSGRREYEPLPMSKAVSLVAKEWMYAICRIPEMELNVKLTEF